VQQTYSVYLNCFEESSKKEEPSYGATGSTDLVTAKYFKAVINFISLYTVRNQLALHR
jgi:hypothetical protein